MYTGLYGPDGRPGIMQDGSRQQDLETMVTNQETERMYMQRLLNLGMSVFRWENLPEGVDERMMEYWLLRFGFVGFFHDEQLTYDDRRRAPEGYAVLPLMLHGEWDIYEYPRERTAYSTNGFNYQLTEENSVIVFNTYLRAPMMPVIRQFAHRLADAQRTIDVNVRQQRTARVIRCDERQRLTYLNAAKEVDEGRPWIHGDRNLDLGAFQVFDVSTPYVAQEIQAYKHQIWNEALTYLGIENVNTDKKERLISDEVINNMGDVEAERFTRLNARKQACKEINELFGLDVDVDFRSGQYIRSSQQSRVLVPTTGMEESANMGDDYDE